MAPTGGKEEGQAGAGKYWQRDVGTRMGTLVPDDWFCLLNLISLC